MSKTYLDNSSIITQPTQKSMLLPRSPFKWLDVEEELPNFVQIFSIARIPGQR